MEFKHFQQHVKATKGYSKYVGFHESHHVIFFDFLRDDMNEIQGFKYAVACDIQIATKAEVLNAMHRWIFHNENLPYYIRYKFAITDKDRFMKPLGLDF